MTFDYLNLVTVTVTCWYRSSGLIRFFNQSRLLYSRLIKALRIALRLSLHRTIGPISAQSIKVLGAVLIIQLAHYRILGAV